MNPNDLIWLIGGLAVAAVCLWLAGGYIVWAWRGPPEYIAADPRSRIIYAIHGALLATAATVAAVLAVLHWA